MKEQHMNGTITNGERETHLCYDYATQTWTMDSTIPRDFNRAIKQSWTPVSRTIDKNGHVCGMVLETHGRGVTIRDTTKKRKTSNLCPKVPFKRKFDELTPSIG